MQRRFLSLALVVAALASPLFGQARSLNSDVPLNVTWVNQSHHAVNLYWVDFQGVEQYYGAIPGGGQMDMASYATHVFRAKANQQIVSAFQLAPWPRTQTLVVARDATPPIPPANNLESAILLHVNAQRASAGLPPMQMLPALNAAAASHSQSMANGSVPFGHDNFQSRLQAAAQQAGVQHRGGAENVAYRYDRDAAAVVQQWMNSPGHRRNILGNYTMIGIGTATGRDGTVYYTQMFL